MRKGGRLPSLKARRQDETYGDLSSALLEVPFRNLFPVSVKSYSQKTCPHKSDAILSITANNKLKTFNYRI